MFQLSFAFTIAMAFAFPTHAVELKTQLKKKYTLKSCTFRNKFIGVKDGRVDNANGKNNDFTVQWVQQGEFFELSFTNLKYSDRSVQSRFVEGVRYRVTATQGGDRREIHGHRLTFVVPGPETKETVADTDYHDIFVRLNESTWEVVHRQDNVVLNHYLKQWTEPSGEEKTEITMKRARTSENFEVEGFTQCVEKPKALEDLLKVLDPNIKNAVAYAESLLIPVENSLSQLAACEANLGSPEANPSFAANCSSEKSKLEEAMKDRDLKWKTVINTKPFRF